MRLANFLITSSISADFIWNNLRKWELWCSFFWNNSKLTNGNCGAHFAWQILIITSFLLRALCIVSALLLNFILQYICKTIFRRLLMIINLDGLALACNSTEIAKSIPETSDFINFLFLFLSFRFSIFYNSSIFNFPQSFDFQYEKRIFMF